MLLPPTLMLVLAVSVTDGPIASPLAASGWQRFDLALADIPFNTAHDFSAPSMAQSLAVTRDFATGVNWAVDLAFQAHLKSLRHRWLWESLALTAAGLATFQLPFFGTWSHEEFHRATMSWRGIKTPQD